jgi:hypothetical protein
MATRCRCERCLRVVDRSTAKVHRKLVYAALYATTLPYAWTLFVLGPGIFGVVPIVAALGLSVDAEFRDWDFPEPTCPHCGDSTEWAPVVAATAPAPARGRRAAFG